MRILSGAKSVLLLACVLFCLGQIPAEASEAQQSLSNTVNQVLNELKKPEFKTPAGRGPILQRIEGIILNLFSMDELSQRTVGPKWQSFSPAEREDFKKAFQDLLRARYVGALEGYAGETVTWLGERAIGSGGTQVQIDSTIMVRGKAVPMNYRMIRKNKWVVYDIFIEGVSLVQNYRSQFQSVLQRGTARQLIDLVRQKAAETSAAKGK